MNKVILAIDPSGNFGNDGVGITGWIVVEHNEGNIIRHSCGMIDNSIFNNSMELHRFYADYFKAFNSPNISVIIEKYTQRPGMKNVYGQRCY